MFTKQELIIIRNLIRTSNIKGDDAILVSPLILKIDETIKTGFGDMVESEGRMGVSDESTGQDEKGEDTESSTK